MPPGFTGDLRGITYCPEAAILAAAEQARAGRAGEPELPGELADRHHQRRRGSRRPPLPRGREDVPVRALQGRAAEPCCDHPGARRSLRLRRRRRPRRPPRRPADRPGQRRLGHGAVDHRRRADPDALDPGQHRQAQLHDQPDQLLDPFAVDSQGIGDQGTITDFSSYFNAVNCACLPFKPKMTMKQVGGRKTTKRSKNPQLQFDLTTRPGDANIKSIAVTLSKAFEIDQRHLGNICTRERTGRDRVRRADQRSARRRPTTPLLDQPLEGPVYAVSGSGGLPRLAFILNGQVDLMPRADTTTVNGGRSADHGPGRPRRADRPLPPDRLRRQDRLPRQHPGHLQAHAEIKDRVHRPERQDELGNDQDQGALREEGVQAPRQASRALRWLIPHHRTPG